MNQIITAEFERTDLGNIQIAPDVIAIIAGLATIEVEGVAGMSGGFAGGIAELLGRKNLSRGVNAEVGQREAAVDVNLIVEYGRRIPTIAGEIQQNVKRSIEMMTGLHVTEVNVNVHDVHVKSQEKSEETDVSMRVK